MNSVFRLWVVNALCVLVAWRCSSVTVLADFWSDSLMSTNEQPDAARIEANAAAIAVNPVYENERLAELTHWGAPLG